MALVLEDGTGLEDADSFVSLAEVRAFASSRGVTLSEDDATVETLIILAHDYILAREGQLQGIRLKESQALPYPRRGVCLYGRYLADGVIPRTLKSAIAQLVIESLTISILPARTDSRVVRETVGPITTVYSDGKTTFDPQPVMPRVDAFLGPLLNSNYLNGLRV